MKAYIIRRLLLVPITLLGVTFLVFALSRLMPGGPIQKMIQAQNQAATEGKSSSSSGGKEANDDEAEKLAEEFGYDKIIPIAYLNWLGALPRDRNIVKKELPTQTVGLETKNWGGILVERRGDHIVSVKNNKGKALDIGEGIIRLIKPNAELDAYRVEVQDEGEKKDGQYPFLVGEKRDVDPTVHAQLVLLDTGNRLFVEVDAQDPTKIITTRYMKDSANSVEEDGWKIIVQSPELRKEAYALRHKKKLEDVNTVFDYRIKIYKSKFNGVLQGSFGNSIKYQDSVSSMMLKRVPVALYFGILSVVIIYTVCIPLGVLKAIYHRTLLDNVSSIFIFIGYSIPGYALGAILLVYLGARGGWFPLFGLMSADAENMNFFEKVIDLLHHTVLPLMAYVIAGFASLTMLMKNSLMDNLSADYVRTAVAKGVGFKGAVFKHAFRNSFIPIATDLGSLISIFVGGSMLIERVFDIPGFGLLSFNSIEERDQTVIMGTLTVSAFLMLVGNILSDIIVAIVDPRIKFTK